MPSIEHPIPPVWNEHSRVLILGTMPSPKSRESGFFYMHPQNRFWNVMAQVFGERFKYKNNGLPSELENAATKSSDEKTDIPSAITERRDFLLKHHIAIWDVLASCEIEGASDATIKNPMPNDFTPIFEASHIRTVFCTGKTAFTLWKKHCAHIYEARYKLTCICLPSTSPANAQWSLPKLVEEYGRQVQIFMNDK